MHRTPVMRFFVSPVFCVTRFMQFIFFHLCLELYISIWDDENVEPNANYSHFRWLDQLEAILVVLEPEGMAIHPHLHLRASQKFLPLKLKSCGSWCKLSSSREVGIMLIKCKRRATRTFSLRSPRYSPKRMSHWMHMLGFAQSSPSFLYWLLLVPKRTRLAMPRSNYAGQLVCGGIITTECYQLIMWWIGMSSRMPFELIIFQQDFLIVSLMSFWR